MSLNTLILTVMPGQGSVQFKSVEAHFRRRCLVFISCLLFSTSRTLYSFSPLFLFPIPKFSNNVFFLFSLYGCCRVLALSLPLAYFGQTNKWAKSSCSGLQILHLLSSLVWQFALEKEAVVPCFENNY